MMKRILLLVSPIIFILQALPTFANPRLDQIDSLFNTLEKNGRLVCQFAILKGDSILYERAVGEGQQDKSGIPMLSGKNDMLRIGSVTKAFTAVLVLKLVEEGKLSLDTKLDKFFPDIKNAQLITIDHMLSHTSGMQDPRDLFSMVGDTTSWLYTLSSVDSIVRKYQEQESGFLPGTKLGYSNTAYYFLGLILERVSGQSYAQLVESRICKPLRLKRTRVLTDRSTGPEMPPSFVRTGRDWEGFPVENCVHVGGAGAIVSTTRELCQFGNALFACKLINSASLEHMLKIDSIPGVERGMVRTPTLVPGKMSYQHLGGIDAYRAILMCIPEDSISIAMLINGANYPFNETFLKLLDASQGTDIVIPSFSAYNVPIDSLNLYVGIYKCPPMGGMEMHVTRTGNSLTAQVVGQNAFSIEPISVNRFQTTDGDFLMTFRRDKKTGVMNFFSYQGIRADNVRWDRVIE